MNLSRPFFSVVIPTYNHLHFLKRALRSVLRQTYDSFEIIVIDNQSTDGTSKYIEGLSDKRIKCLKTTNNGVIARSRNIGIESARGDWIAFLDSDDWWLPTKLEAIFHCILSDINIDIFCHSEIAITSSSRHRKRLNYGPVSKNMYVTLLELGNRLSTSATVVRRRFLEDHAILFRTDERLVTIEDYALWVDLALHGAKFNFIYQTLGVYRLHGNNLSLNDSRHLTGQQTLIELHRQLLTHAASQRNVDWKLVSARYSWLANSLCLRDSIFLRSLSSFKVFAKYPLCSIKLSLLRRLTSLRRCILSFSH